MYGAILGDIIGSPYEFDQNNIKTTGEHWKHHVYLSTHTFYGKHYEQSTKLLKEHGFDVEIDNWDK